MHVQTVYTRPSPFFWEGPGYEAKSCVVGSSYRDEFAEARTMIVHCHTYAILFLLFPSSLTLSPSFPLCEIDRDFFEASKCHDYLFCHCWLLLDFKRELNIDGVISK